MSFPFRLIVCILLFPCNGLAQGGTQEIDLEDHWLVYKKDKFVKADKAATHSVFFWIDARKEKGSILRLGGRHDFSIWINSKLALRANGNVSLLIDSLAHIYSSQLFVAVFSAQGVHHMQTTLLKKNERAADGLVVRKGNYFLDFTIFASLILLTCFTLLLRTNPTLTFDYLNVNKLFSFQDRDESTLTLRIASSVNLLVYFFCSMFLGLILLVSFHLMGGQLAMTSRFSVQSTSQGFQQWFVISLLIFALLILKLVWLVLLSKLFGFRDIVRIQFFNFVRIILIAVSILTLLTVVYFVINVRNERYFFHLLSILSIIFVCGAMITYLKLMARLPLHFFHLFSYLCASEIIPLMVLIKVFFY